MDSTRRKFVQGTSLGAGALVLNPIVNRLLCSAEGLDPEKLPQRFVFVMKSSGIIPERIVPASLAAQAKDSRQAINEPLADHRLPKEMAPLEKFKSHVSILQGISGKMCKGGHSSWFGALGVYKTGGEHNSGSILRATIDAELAKLFPSPFQHVGLALRGKVMGKETEGTLYPGISAVAPGRELPFQASPDVAYDQLFGSAISGSQQAKQRYQLKSNLLDFMIDDLRTLNRSLPATEKEKLQHYLSAFEELKIRRAKLAKMEKQIKQHAPKRSDQLTSTRPTIRQKAHFDLLAAALIAGITNVVTLRLDNISTNYGDLGLSEKNVHGIGHGEVCNGKSPQAARDIIRLHHMKLLADLADKLQRIPEGDGTMLDNTLIIYMSDSGNEHHGNLNEWPYILIGGGGGKLKLTGRYIQVPGYGQPGHQTIGNWYTTLLHAYGNPVEHFGNLDLHLQKNGVKQTGPIEEWI